MIGAAVAALLASGAMAQTANQGSHNPALKNRSVSQVEAPANGRNSFTEGQARGRIAKAGYSGVSRLQKDRRGVWRGMAMRHGRRVHIGLDYKGDVTNR